MPNSLSNLTRTSRVRARASAFLVGSSIFIASSSCFPDLTRLDAAATLFTSVSSGFAYTCGLTPTGTAYCWTLQDGRPLDVSTGLAFKTVNTRTDHTCGIVSDGSAYCWGRNLTGQLGVDSTTGYCQIPGSTVSVACSTYPLRVSGNLAFQIVEVGTSHTCGLTTAGEAFCWGNNTAGRLGATTSTLCAAELVVGGFPCSPVPVRVDGGFVFETLSVGAAHTCGLVANGEAYCWGLGSWGRLGDGNTDNRTAPVKVAGNIQFDAIDAGGAHTCGIANGGELYCWGSNTDMQIGTQESDTSAVCGGSLYRCILTPRRVHPNLSFVEVTASDGVNFSATGERVGGHTCGRTQNAVYCWGLNEQGQLKHSNQLRTAEAVEIKTGEEFVSLSAGNYHTCGLTVQQRIECWPFGSPWEFWYVPTEG